MIISCKLATTEYGAETFFQSQLVLMIDDAESSIMNNHNLTGVFPGVSPLAL